MVGLVGDLPSTTCSKVVYVKLNHAGFYIKVICFKSSWRRRGRPIGSGIIQRSFIFVFACGAKTYLMRISFVVRSMLKLTCLLTVYVQLTFPAVTITLNAFFCITFKDRNPKGESKIRKTKRTSQKNRKWKERVQKGRLGQIAQRQIDVIDMKPNCCSFDGKQNLVETQLLFSSINDTKLNGKREMKNEANCFPFAPRNETKYITKQRIKP